jgi:4-hydroxybenzoate polyprenyltransferase
MIRNTFIALFAAWGIHMLIIAVMGSFYDVREIKEVLGGNSTLPIFLPTLAICLMYLIYHTIKTHKKIQSKNS